MDTLNWTPLNDKVARLNARLDTLTAKPAKLRTHAERGQISVLAKQKRGLLGTIKARRDAYLARLARIGLDS